MGERERERAFSHPTDSVPAAEEVTVALQCGGGQKEKAGSTDTPPPPAPGGTGTKEAVGRGGAEDEEIHHLPQTDRGGVVKRTSPGHPKPKPKSIIIIHIHVRNSVEVSLSQIVSYTVIYMATCNFVSLKPSNNPNLS